HIDEHIARGAAEEAQIREHPPLGGEERGVDALAIRRTGEVVRHQPVQDLDWVAAVHAERDPVGTVDEAGAGTDGLVLGRRIAVAARHRPTADLGESGAERLVDRLEWMMFLHTTVAFRGNYTRDTPVPSLRFATEPLDDVPDPARVRRLRRGVE